MTTDVNVINWSKTLPLDCHITTPVFHSFINLSDDTSGLSNLTTVRLHLEQARRYGGIEASLYPKKSTLLLQSDRLKRNIEESRKAFLNQSIEDTPKPADDNKLDDCNKENVEQRKIPSRKISFKCKKPSFYRRAQTIGSKVSNTLNPNTVAELTTKFNEMGIERHSIFEQPKFARLVRRANSQRSDEGINKKVIRKPSVKLKPSFRTEDKILCEQKKRLLVPKYQISINNIDKTQSDNSDNTIENRCLNIKSDEANSLLRLSRTSLNSGSVRATIEIFERRTSQSSSPVVEQNSIVKEIEKVPKPKVPEKNPNLKTKDLVIKDGVRKLKSLEKRESRDIINKTNSAKSVPQLVNVTTNDETEIKTEGEDEIVQIVNIPLVMPRRCDSMYETVNLKKVSLPTEQLKTSKSESAFSIETLVKPNASFLWRQKSQETQQNLVQTDKDVWESLYDKVEAKLTPPAVPPRPTTLNIQQNKTPLLTFLKDKMPLPEELDEKIYEELVEKINNNNDGVSYNYEYCHSSSKYEDLEKKSDDGYECFDTPSPTKHEEQSEGIYETLPDHFIELPPPLLPRKQKEPLPPRPMSRESYDTIQNPEDVSNCYESIYNSGNTNSSTKAEDGDGTSNNYESIYGCHIRLENWELASNRDSLISSDQLSNSLYGRSFSGWTNDDLNVYNGKATSDLSGSSDKSDEWIDISDNEENVKGVSGFVVVRERQRNRKSSGWSQKIRDQWNKSHSLNQGDSDLDHHYESLYNKRVDYQDNDDFDSFESDTESESSFTKATQNGSGVDMRNSQLPDPPASQSYGFTRLAVSAGKQMRRLRRNWSLTKNDITKSLSRMAKRKSRSDLETIDKQTEEKSSPTSSITKIVNNRPISSPIMLYQANALSNVTQELKSRQAESTTYQNVQISNKENIELTENNEKIRSNSLSKNRFLNKFRKSMSIIEQSSDIQSIPNKTKSTFYLTDAIEVDGSNGDVAKPKPDEVVSVASSNILKNSKVNQRPNSPPPPVPVDANQNVDSLKLKINKRSTSWYAECGLFRNAENMALHPISNKRPNTSWYAEIGLYQSSASTPSTSSTENSGSAINENLKSAKDYSSNEVNNDEDYYNIKNENDYYNDSIGSFSSDTTEKCSSPSPDIQLRLQDEPLYQFYDAAVLESVCQDGTSDFEYDGYEEVGDKSSSDYSGSQLSARPSAMELVSLNKNGVAVLRTLWCEIPEVLQSTVLSTLSIYQKKLQEAKFEMMTSEASYLNSLNVLTDHFISNLTNSDLLTYEEKNILFSKIPAVKRCSEKLLSDMEKCWQDNILLHGICDIIKKHAEENFCVYVSYCENQILLDSTLRKIRERSSCNELLKQLECCSACQSLALYSFLMLPMQRITRWPLLVDAVLKRLSPQDDEYLSCQYTLATINKIVTQCNEAARKMERETEIKRIASQIDFPRNTSCIKLASGSRWLIRSGQLMQMLGRGDDIKLTFGKRFTKVPLHLFLFNDLLLVTKAKNDETFTVVHYCNRSYIELNVNDAIGSLPVKDTQSRHLLFLTMLENHEGKTVELLLSCSSESDKERWIEALSSPKSEDPNETLYECWDCPQVTALHNYCASQPDELALSRGDIVNVTRKMADGWYHGERIRDGETGWFPANYTVEVANPHVRARNLKQRYRLLAFSENYLKSK